MDTAGDVGWYTSIALDSGDSPHISYYDDTYDELKYARWNGTGWSIETVDAAGSVGWYTSIALDSMDNPHISYYDDTYDELKYARWMGSSWSVNTVDSDGNVGWHTSIALDSNDYSHISYLDSTDADLKYAVGSTSYWNIETVDSAGDVGWYTSIALDSDDDPHMSYYDFTNGDLKYARWTGSAWSIEAVDSAGSVGWYTSIALDSNDYPHISYYEHNPKYDLKFARWNGIGWTIETVDSDGNVGWHTSIALDSKDYPHISYLDYTNGDLKYAYGQLAGTSITLDVESGPVGTMVGVTGTGFESGGTVSQITVDGVECGTIDDPIPIDAGGEFSGEFVIPQVSEEKPCMVTVMDSGGNFANASFEVTGLADIEVEPSYGAVGSTINIDGFNFTAITGEDVELELWKDGSYLLHIKTFETDSNGEFSGNFNVPPTSEGIYDLVANQDYYNINASTPFKVGLIMAIISPSQGPTGTLVQLTGIGFTPAGEWNATFDGIPIFSHETVDPDSTIEGDFFVPTVDMGYQTVSVLDIDTEIELTVDFEVTGLAEITLDPAYGELGEMVAIDGYNFSARAGETVVLELWHKGSWILEIDTFETSSAGTFSGSFVVPAVPSDMYDIVANQDEFSISASRAFEVVSEPLQIDVYTDKTVYIEGDTMNLGLDIVNTGPAANVCLEIWVELPDTSTVTIMHAHDITLPHGLDYSNPSFESFMLPNVPPGVYTWHAALLDPPTHDVLLEDTVEWEFRTGQLVQFGVIVPWEYDLDRYGPIFDFAEEDINNYCAKLGYDISFHFLIEHANASAATHLEKVQMFDTMDVNLLVAGFWSSQAQGSLSYVNANDMLMFSPSSTHPGLAIPDDNLFRMCPDDTQQASVMVETLNSYDEGIEAVVLIQRADPWGDWLYDEFEAQYMDSGGVIWERLRYDPETSDFSAYLSTANGAMHSAVAFYGWDHVAVQLFGMDESVQLLNQSQGYSAAYNVTWFGSEVTALHYGFDEIPEVANHLKVYSPSATPTKSWKWWEIYDRYLSETGQTMTFYMGCAYDICWTYAKAVLEARTTDTNVIKGILGDVAGDFFGVTGPCRLNDSGDRYATNYDIWGYGDHYGYDWYLYGVYNRFTGEVHWDEDLIPWR